MAMTQAQAQINEGILKQCVSNNTGVWRKYEKRHEKKAATIYVTLKTTYYRRGGVTKAVAVTLIMAYKYSYLLMAIFGRNNGQYRIICYK